MIIPNDDGSFKISMDYTFIGDADAYENIMKDLDPSKILVVHCLIHPEIQEPCIAVAIKDKTPMMYWKKYVFPMHLVFQNDDEEEEDGMNISMDDLEVSLADVIPEPTKKPRKPRAPRK